MEKPANCTCDYPRIIVRNGVGHPKECPVWAEHPLGGKLKPRAEIKPISPIFVGLTELVNIQKTNWKMSTGESIGSSPGEVAIAAMALTDEIGECAKEVGWKPWKPNQQRVEERILDEWADVCAFFGTFTAVVLHATGGDLSKLVNAYYEKTRVNRERFTGTTSNGYGQMTEEQALAYKEEWDRRYPRLARTIQILGGQEQPIQNPEFETEYFTTQFGRVQFMGWEGSESQNWVLYDPNIPEGGNHWRSIPAHSIKLFPVSNVSELQKV